MFTIIFIVSLMHIVIYLCYPDTTIFGLGYLFASSILWIAFIGVINSSVRSFKDYTRNFISFLVYFIILYVTMSYYPQSDGKSVLDKIAEGKYPVSILSLGELKDLG